MPTQSRGHGTQRGRHSSGSGALLGVGSANGYEGSCGPGFSLQGERRFVKPPAKTKRISRRGAEHAEKGKGTRFDLRLLPFVAPQTFEIVSACEDFIERSGFSPSLLLAFSACSAPLREVLPSPLAALPPGAMPTTRLSSPKSALRGHVLGSLAEYRGFRRDQAKNACRSEGRRVCGGVATSAGRCRNRGSPARACAGGRTDCGRRR